MQVDLKGLEWLNTQMEIYWTDILKMEKPMGRDWCILKKQQTIKKCNIMLETFYKISMKDKDSFLLHNIHTRENSKRINFKVKARWNSSLIMRGLLARWKMVRWKRENLSGRCEKKNTNMKDYLRTINFKGMDS